MAVHQSMDGHFYSKDNIANYSLVVLQFLLLRYREMINFDFAVNESPSATIR